MVHTLTPLLTSKLITGCSVLTSSRRNNVCCQFRSSRPEGLLRSARPHQYWLLYRLGDTLHKSFQSVFETSRCTACYFLQQETEIICFICYELCSGLLHYCCFVGLDRIWAQRFILHESIKNSFKNIDLILCLDVHFVRCQDWLFFVDLKPNRRY